MPLTKYAITGSLRDALDTGPQTHGTVLFEPVGSHDSRVEDDNVLLGPIGPLNVAEIADPYLLDEGLWTVRISTKHKLDGGRPVFQPIVVSWDHDSATTWGELIAGAVSPLPLSPTIPQQVDAQLDSLLPAKVADSGDPVGAALSATYAGLSAAPRALAARPFPVVAQPAETVVTRFQSGHGWSVSGTWTTNLNDTAELGGLATQAVTGTTAGTSSGDFLNSPTLTAFDPTGKHFVVWLKISDPSRLTALTMRLGADTSFTNSTTLTVIANSTSVMPNEWTRVVFSMASPSSTSGTGVGTSCVKMQLRIQDKTSQPLTVAYGGISYRTQPTKATVVFTFDDGWASVYTEAKAALSRQRYRASVYPILDQIGGAGRVTKAQLLELQNNFGWEIGGHSNTIADHAAGFTTLSAGALEAELAACKAYLVDNGFTGNTFAYAINSYNRAVIDATRRYFTGARTTDPGQQETWPAWDNMRVRAYSVVSGDSLATLQGKVDTAVTFGQTLVFCIHDVAASGGAITPTNLQGLVDYVAGKGSSVQVRTLEQALAGV